MVHFGGHKSHFLKSFLCFTLTLAISSSVVNNSFAMSHYARTIFKENSILMWNPEEDCDTSVTIIGDSITARSREQVAAAVPDATINAKDGRPWVTDPQKDFGFIGDGGLDIVAGGVESGILVWLLGANNRGQAKDYYRDLEEKDIAALYSAVGASTTVLLMTLYDSEQPNVYDHNNSLIRSAASKYENFHILDWNAIATPEYIAVDANDDSWGTYGVHLSDAGKSAFASMIEEGVNQYTAEINGGCQFKNFGNIGCGANGGATAIVTGDNQQTIFSYLVANGFSITSAAAILGNLAAENGAFNPYQLEIGKNSTNTVNDGFVAYRNGAKTFVGGFGIAQWTSAGRVKNLQAYADSKGLSVTSIQVQTEFLYNELTGAYHITPDLLNSMSLADATEYIMKHYESPADQSDAKVQARVKKAEQFVSMDASEGGAICSGDTLANQPLVSGGMDLTAATSFMQAYRNISPREVSQNPQLAEWGITSNNCKGSDLENCVSFVKWYMANYTSSKPSTIGNGGQVVKNLISNYGWESNGTTPKVYSVFSTSSGSTLCDGVVCGHTGVVLGIDEARGKIIVGEAGCSAGFSWTNAHEYSLTRFVSGTYTYANPPGLNV